MKIAIISDIHSNLAAFQAVLNKLDCDKAYCLGDIVGYGPQPNECLDLARKHLEVVVAGNHDYGSVGKIDISGFSDEAQFVCNWTKEKLSLEDFAYLEQLPLTKKVASSLTLVHGSLASPLLEYVLTRQSAKKSLNLMPTPVCFFGHTHLPIIYKQKGRRIKIEGLLGGQNKVLDQELKYLINPGSVGQPRDGNPKASYLVFDTETYSVTLKRVDYDVAKTQKLMQKAGLPPTLIERLSVGL